MKWRELRSALKKKLAAEQQPGAKHDFWHVKCGDKYVGAVMDGHGEGDMRTHEVGHCAKSLGANEHDFKLLVACPMSGEEFCAKYHGPTPNNPAAK
jgi:hypothetical protein